MSIQRVAIRISIFRPESRITDTMPLPEVCLFQGRFQSFLERHRSSFGVLCLQIAQRDHVV